MRDKQYLNEAAAQVMTAKDAIWQLGNTLRDCMSRLETIQETNPELAVDAEIKQARHTLERYAKGPLHYSPHPFGWPYDPYVLKDYHAEQAKVTRGRSEGRHGTGWDGKHDSECEHLKVKVARCGCRARAKEQNSPGQQP